MFGLNTKVGKSYFKDAEDKLFVTSIFYTLQGEGPLRGIPAVFVRLAKCNLGCSWCFHGNTLISMSDGTRKEISEIQLNDEVITWNENEHKFENKCVTYVHSPRKVDSILKIKIGIGSNSEITGYVTTYVTDEHPYWVVDKGWVKAKDLEVDDKLFYQQPIIFKTRYGLLSKLINESKVLSVENLTSEETVYNFETQDNHTYIANGNVVHNCDAFFEDGDWLTVDEILKKASQEIDKYFQSQEKDVPSWANLNTINPWTRRQIAFIVTGGEPTLQNDNLYDLLYQAGLEYKWTQIESNGVLEANVPDDTIVVISPKCNEKVDISQGFKRYIPTGYMKPNKQAIAKASVLKFIIEDNPDFDSPYSTIPDWAFEWREQTGRDIFVSPMNIYNKEPKKAQEIRSGKNKASLEERSLYDEVVSWWEPGLFDMDSNERNHKHAAKYAMDNGLIFQVQLHLFASLA